MQEIVRKIIKEEYIPQTNEEKLTYELIMQKKGSDVEYLQLMHKKLEEQQYAYSNIVSLVKRIDRFGLYEEFPEIPLYGGAEQPKEEYTAIDYNEWEEKIIKGYINKYIDDEFASYIKMIIEDFERHTTKEDYETEEILNRIYGSLDIDIESNLIQREFVCSSASRRETMIHHLL